MCFLSSGAKRLTDARNERRHDYGSIISFSYQRVNPLRLCVSRSPLSFPAFRRYVVKKQVQPLEYPLQYEERSNQVLLSPLLHESSRKALRTWVTIFILFLHTVSFQKGESEGTQMRGEQNLREIALPAMYSECTFARETVSISIEVSGYKYTIFLVKIQ